jgi:hypothetical protein
VPYVTAQSAQTCTEPQRCPQFVIRQLRITRHEMGFCCGCFCHQLHFGRAVHLFTYPLPLLTNSGTPSLLRVVEQTIYFCICRHHENTLSPSRIDFTRFPLPIEHNLNSEEQKAINCVGTVPSLFVHIIMQVVTCQYQISLCSSTSYSICCYTISLKDSSIWTLPFVCH